RHPLVFDYIEREVIMYEKMFDGLEIVFKWLLVICIISVPLAVWKLVDVIVWMAIHVTIQ
ncbi:hypothetical protein LCGC14_1478890, partial [marine sediment metagenome]